MFLIVHCQSRAWLTSTWVSPSWDEPFAPQKWIASFLWLLFIHVVTTASNSCSSRGRLTTSVVACKWIVSLPQFWEDFVELLSFSWAQKSRCSGYSESLAGWAKFGQRLLYVDSRRDGSSIWACAEFSLWWGCTVSWYWGQEQNCDSPSPVLPIVYHDVYSGSSGTKIFPVAFFLSAIFKSFK